ncbi:H-NS histone family protein [Chitinibacter bivalviorum]|uniref:H-NS histone family protein n=1 Tax=Chitinibacter bivalviorum TaxID=2739434 RepID=A0A7H9BHD7_9NEIS|nr:H-NS histone family protein [Chitinibacter bivalviorum]QLG87676.1 H-NS histone family protein [Chitinibacter bivalviorum]
MNAPQDFRTMTTETVGKDLLNALMQEIRLLPDVWQKLSKAKQDDVIDRLRNRVESNIKMAVHTLASAGRTVVAGDLEQITIKDGVKAVVKFGASTPNLHQLYEASSKAVLVVVANPGDHTGGMDEVTGESDQRGLDLGHEYHDNDGGGMDEKRSDDSNVVDAEFYALPAPGFESVTEEELEQTFNDGYAAAEEGKLESDCPILKGELCIAWVKGWKHHHAEAFENNQTDVQQQSETVTSLVKYRNPNDPSQTWTGRGRQPAWIQDWVANGGTLEELEDQSDKE